MLNKTDDQYSSMVFIILCLIFSLLARLFRTHPRMEPLAAGISAGGSGHRRQMARQYECGHDEAVGVHHGHRDGPVVR
jgi:hypothetical protein